MKTDPKNAGACLLGRQGDCRLLGRLLGEAGRALHTQGRDGMQGPPAPLPALRTAR